MKVRTPCLVIVLLFVGPAVLFAQSPVVLNFDNLAPGTVIGNLYQSQGVIFANAVVQSSSLAPSPPNDIGSTNTSPIVFSFPFGGLSVSVQIDTDGYNTDRQPQIRVYASDGSLLGTKLFAQGPDIESFQGTSSPIYSVLLGSCPIYGDSTCPVSSMFPSDAYDNITFQTTATPEPGALILCLSGLTTIAFRRLRGSC